MSPPPAPASRPFIRKLERLGPLGAEGRRRLEEVPLDVRRVGADRDLIRDGERPSYCLLLLDGMAHRYKSLEDGRRQIVSFHVPGDILDLAGLLLGRMDHAVGALTPVEVAPLAHATVLDWMRRHPDLGGLLWRDTLVDAAVFREWVVNVGRRTASQRVAHLLCELATRLFVAGSAPSRACDLPVARVDLADATGLSAVHVGRVVQELCGAGLIEARGRTVAVRDWEGLKRAGGFDPRYLHPLAAAA